MKIVKVEPHERGFNVHWQDGSKSDFPYIWLRDNDPNELHPHTQERTFDLTSVDIEITPKSHDVSRDALIVSWPEKKDPSIYDAKWLSSYQPGKKRHDPSKIERVSWSSDDMRELPRANAPQCHTSAAALHQALIDLKTYGIVIVDNLDDDPQAGERFGDLIGFKRQTNFGVMFEVVNMPNPNNLAYTALSLPQHTDLSNQELVPGIQFLHCCKNTATGGQSTFTDALRVVEDFKAELPSAYRVLCETLVPWRFHDETCDVRYRRPVINFDNDGEFKLLCLNPHLADIPDMPADQLYDFYAAYQKIMRRTRDDQYMIRYALQTGEMAVFDNQRLMHGRTEFDPNSGERHLRGYYIEHNELNSKIRLLDRQ